MGFLRGLVLLALALLFFSAGFAQKKGFNYDSAWKKVEDLMTKQGLTQSAQKEAEKIYAQAKKEGNDAQRIKSLLYLTTLTQVREEDDFIKNVDRIRKEISSSTQPSTSILHSILASEFQNYFGQHRYQFYNRTPTTERPADLKVWTARNFEDEIDSLFSASLAHEKILSNQNLDEFDPIILKGNTRYLRPTLYDLLAHRALEYYSAAERDVSSVVEKFDWADPRLFASTKEFANIKFATGDSSTLKYKAILLFQRLTAFHLNDTRPDALIDLDLERLNFVKQWSELSDKEKHFKNSMENIISSYPNDSASAKASYFLANYYVELSNDVEQKADAEWQTALERALEICDKTIRRFPKSEGGVDCQNLSKAILSRFLQLETEYVNIPGQPFRTLVSYKNFSTVYFRIIRLDSVQTIDQPEYYYSNYWEKLVGLKSISSWKQDLPKVADYRSHNVEVKVDALPSGEYILLASVNADFSLNKNTLAMQFLYVSNISYINRGREFFVLHRETGMPLDGAKVQRWKQVYDQKESKYVSQKYDYYLADKNGHFRIKGSKAEDRSFRYEISWKKEHLFPRVYQYEYYTSYDEENNNDYKNQKEFDEDNAKVWLFTDRSIYRPGQTVYFKGIAITKDIKTKKAIIWNPRQKLEIAFYDANSEKIDSLFLTVNEFGSLSGNFRIPEGSFTGSFHIEVEDADDSKVEFNVEQYKRPKFYVELEKPKGSYRLNDSVIVSGVAKAYAGNNIDGAKINYRVARIPRLLFPWLYWGKILPRHGREEIAHGSTQTNSEGKFTFSFKAIPDAGIDSTLNPVFDYQIFVDVTDINGETRIGNSTVQVGYKSLLLSTDIDVNKPVNLDSFNHLKIITQNLAGEFAPANVGLKITRLLPPDRLIRKRLWNAPDQFLYNEPEFIRFFPHDEYRDEKEIQNWKRGSVALSESFLSSRDELHRIDKSKFSEGYYEVEIVGRDSLGRDVKQVQYLQLYSPSSNGLPAADYFWMVVDKKIANPGEKLQSVSGTAASNVYVIQEKRNDDQTEKSNYTFFTLNKEKKAIEWLVTEGDRGGFGVDQFFVKDNRFYDQHWLASVPWTNKSLDINFQTFRDKLEPGSKENWRINIKGERADAISAEALLNMYDASLDQFYYHNWSLPQIWQDYLDENEQWNAARNFTAFQSILKTWNEPRVFREKVYDQIVFYGGRIGILRRGAAFEQNKLAFDAAPKAEAAGDSSILLQGEVAGLAVQENLQSVVVTGIGKTRKKAPQDASITPRKNFNETAFFFPDLKTDADGSVSFSFTMPEALTQWKLMALAHTKDLSIGYAEKMVVTQKQLMVQPNAPRFLRDGDTISFSAKIANISDKEMKGEVQLELFDAATNQPVDQLFANERPTIPFIVAAGQSVPVQFELNIPKDYSSALSYRIIAKAGNYSDGEENALPVLPNRMLVTESITLPMNGAGTKTFKFEKLLQSGKSSNTLSQHALTAEYTANPAWYAVQSLPYLIEFPHECSEQTFSRFYANALATAIANSNPGIKKVWENWKNMDSSALLSNLQKNEELKSALLQETPWVMEAKTEAAQKKNLGLLFDLGRMSNEMNTTISKLSEAQLSNGGFAWFKGGTDDRYITQLILTGIGKLEKMNAIPNSSDYIRDNLDDMETKALKYADQRMVDEYNALVRRKTDLKKNNLDYFVIHYLYMRSFFLKEKLAPNAEKIVAYYRGQAKQFWLQQNRYMQGMIALALNRAGDSKTATAILASLKENSIYNEELGRYWKDNRGGFYWQEAPVETQSLLIEAFSEISMNEKTVNELKTWLLKQKQTNHWNSTKSTADACYALLLKGTKWQENAANAEISVNNQPLLQTTSSDGLGYAKTVVNANEVKPDMGNITVKVTGAKPGSQPGPSWGAVYWQYFENLDKITSAATPLSLVKKLYIETNTDKGPILNAVTATKPLKVGDKLKIRIELRVDRDMEYVHLKDMRASSMEPLNVLSEYKWQDGLGYYESTRDASTNFFFSYLPKGTYVFEYPVFITHTGNFSVGLATIQCMYAPEFGSHSEGVRISVK